MKFRVICADPPYSFKDKLSMSDVSRGAESNYSILSISDLKKLPIKDISENDAILALWCPSSLLKEGLDIMNIWGFEFKQTHIWVKTKQEIKNTDLNSCLSFGMGRLFRQTHEVVLLGTKGKIYNHLKNKSQRSVHFFPATKHSSKPENLQNMLDKMFPEGNRIELFARRKKLNWLCLGNDPNSDSPSEDIRNSLQKIID